MQDSALWRGSVAQRIRLASGLVLFVYAASHFLNQALGLVSIEAVNAYDAVWTALTRSIPGTLVLCAALLAHAALGVWHVARRRSWTMPAWQWLQVGLGLLIPLQLLSHIVGTRVAASAFGIRTDYTYELARIWTATILPQSLLLLSVWVHGCIGLHFWLRVWTGYRRAKSLLFALAVLWPFAALAGVSVQGRAIEAAAANPALSAAATAPDKTTATLIAAWGADVRIVYAAALVLLGAGILVGTVVVGRRRTIVVRYADGPAVRTEPGPTLLDISRRNAIPHVSVCGGRGRCSTCRVLVIEGAGGLSPPAADERRTLTTIGAGPHVRLACQTVPRTGVTIMPMVKAMPRVDTRQPETTAGTERNLAVLFVDLRGFTALTERQLPFDVIHILNQFFATVGEPIHAFGGWIANYAGDGVIALFGNEDGMEAASRAALFAAAGIDKAMSGLNERLKHEMRQPLRIAMGLHAGPHVMGRVGFGASQPMSVVGLAVNVASRLETLAKQESVQLVLSRVVARHGGLDVTGLRAAPIDVRGLSEPLDVIFVEDAGALLERLEGARTRPAA